MLRFVSKAGWKYFGGAALAGLIRGAAHNGERQRKRLARDALACVSVGRRALELATGSVVWGKEEHWPASASSEQ
jgi:hypothetical protein